MSGCGLRAVQVTFNFAIEGSILESWKKQGGHPLRREHADAGPQGSFAKAIWTPMQVAISALDPTPVYRLE